MLVFTLLLLAVSCEIPFALDNVSEPAIYIELIPASPYKTAFFKVGYAEPPYGKPGVRAHTPAVQDISLSLNGQPVQLEPEAMVNGNLITVVPQDFEPVPGDKVDISVKSGSAPLASASTVIPPLPVLESVEMVPAGEDSTSKTAKVTVKLAGDVKEGEYYGIRLLEKVTIVTLSEGFQTDTTVNFEYKLPGQVASREDLNSLDLDAFANVQYNGALTDEGLNISGPMMLLTAKQFKGASYSFYVSRGSGFDWSILFPEGIDLPEPEMPLGDTQMPDIPQTETLVLVDNAQYVVELYRLSEELYNYFKAQYLMEFNMLSNFGVTPPNFTYSNVLGGLGIVGGISGVRTQWLELPDTSPLSICKKAI
ncbi:MAG: DUF4249 family protein [Bacteroidales bacterium]|nr:DUF4249 family protein [Bacteroidales bacterium]